MKPIKQAVALIESFMEDAQPFMDLLKIEGYFTDDMQLTDKGKAVLQKHWAEKYKGIFDDCPKNS